MKKYLKNYAYEEVIRRLEKQIKDAEQKDKELHDKIMSDEIEFDSEEYNDLRRSVMWNDGLKCGLELTLNSLKSWSDEVGK